MATLTERFKTFLHIDAISRQISERQKIVDENLAELVDCLEKVQQAHLVRAANRRSTRLLRRARGLSRSEDKALPEARWEFTVIKVAGFILPREQREEWIGDLREMLVELQRQGYARWVGVIIALIRVCVLCLALLKIKLRDIASPAKRRRM